jgi:predicted nuclease with TOPRIM domain
LVTGWIKRAMSNERVAVRILIDGQVVAEGKAEYFRQKLFDLGIGDGSHAFAIDISSSLGATQKRIEIRTADGNFLLGEAIMTASVGRRLDDSLGGVELAS